MEQHEHILTRPDMYIGSTRRVEDDMYVWDEETKSIVYRKVKYSPGLYKIFDEVLVNSADNYQKDPSMKFIKVEINGETGTISVHNDGEGIPVEMHKEHNKYVPELIFGDLLTGSSFDDTDAKVTGGRNGLGAKLANIYSKEFTVDVRCKGRTFNQTYRRNMFDRGAPLTSTAKGTDFTKITFKPDLKRFDGMESFDADIIALFKKRVYDIAGCNTKLNVFLNGTKIELRSFKDYVALYFASRPEGSRPSIIGPEILIDKAGRKRWEVVLTVSDGEFRQASFVNSIWTIRGGNHVQAVVKKISESLEPKIKKRNKGTDVKPAMVKSHMFVFVNCLLNNPEFDSQTKETLKSTQSSWGTKLELGEKFLTLVGTKSGIIDQILTWNIGKSASILKTTSAKKKGRISISKLTDANWAGSSKSSQCTLIVTEGDSAKGLAVAGLSIVGRDKYGAFPLRGKVLNVRDAPMNNIVANEELNMVKLAMGLQHDKVYTDVSSLRYGRIMIMTDQDVDGSHIKGLFINFIHHFWPSLARLPGFLCVFVTPIVKATKGDLTHSFFTIPQYSEWLKSTNVRGWTTKYYKGLGTSEPAEMQDYFADLPKHEKHFKYVGEEDDKAIELAFSKSKADSRKEWLASFIPGTQLDQSLVKIPYSEFVNKELILFSMEDCERSIASMVDGFKPGQRKIMFACFKRNLKGEIKIAQLAGYVLEHCAYHHGEVSLYSTMIGMAQNFVGANNLNLLEPVGNFGTRDQGGKDAAAPRYIFTTLSPLTRYIFHPDDDDVLTYLEDEGMQIEPEWYCPVVPTILINGNAGIGTGWSSKVPNYNPSEVVANLRRLMYGEEPLPMHPWYRGFNGTITHNMPKNNYTCRGVWRRLNDESIEITELPIGSWTQKYKDRLEEMIKAQDVAVKEVKKMQKKKKADMEDSDAEDVPKKKKGKKSNADSDDEGDADENGAFTGVNVKDFKEHHTTTTVHFIIFSPDFATLSDEDIEKKMRLTSTISVTNMHLYGADRRISKYPSAVEILKDFFITRLDMYGKRRLFIISRIERDLLILDNKMRFIKEVIEKTLIVSGRKKNDLFADLRKKGYSPFPADPLKSRRDAEIVADIDENGVVIAEDKDESSTRDYDYLLSLPIWSMTHERYMKMVEQVDHKKSELGIMKTIHPADLWERDLDAFSEAWNKFESNMTILDKCGVGGSAFRKPNMQKGSLDASGRKAKSNHAEAFKKLQKLSPPTASQNTETRVIQNRPVIIQPVVKTDPVIPPKKIAGSKGKKSSAAVKMEVVDGPTVANDVEGDFTFEDSDAEFDKPPMQNDAVDSDEEFGVGPSTASTLKRNHDHLPEEECSIPPTKKIFTATSDRSV